MIVDHLRLVGSPQTNVVMAGELARLAARALKRRPPEPRKHGPGSLVYPFDAELADLAVRYHRTSTRVLWDLYQSRAPRLEPLYDELRADGAADQRPWWWDGATVSIRARNLGGFAAGAMQVVGAVKNAVVDAAAARGARLRVEPERPDLPLVLRMADDELTLSIDLGGGSQSQRGWRREAGEAPLREHLAAVLLMLARWDARTDVLVDPMCGAGTIPIEASLMARAEPLLPRMDAALARLPAFAGVTGPRGPLFADAEPAIVGNELDVHLAAGARRNAAAAGAAQRVDLVAGDFRDLARSRIVELAAARGRSAASGVILANPPYGERLDPGDLERLYRDLGAWCRGFAGWRAAFLVANPAFEAAFGRRPRVKKPLANGPVRGYFLLYDL
jgi:23S rRNA (guanine2445-N2)-methyltransferase